MYDLRYRMGELRIGCAFSLGGMLQASAAARPAALALTDGSRRLSFGELDESTERAAGRLCELGVERGDRVGVWMRQTVDSVLAIYAANRAGAAFVVMDPRLSHEQVIYRCNHSGAKIVIVDREFEPQAQQIEVRYVTIDALLATGNAGTAPLPLVIGADLGAILYTSGSTGMPKGVVLSNENLVMGARIVTQYLRLTADDVLLAVLPFHFDYGLNQLTTAALVGATLAIPASAHPRHIHQALVQFDVTGLAGVPPLWIQLLHEHSPFRKGDFPKLRYMTNSGGALPVRYVELLRQTAPHAELFLMYGLTEAFRSTYLPPSELAKRPTSMGKAIPNVEILVAKQDGTLCGPGEIGELVHRGGVICQGYWRDEEATRRVLRPPPSAEPGRTVQDLAVWSGDYVSKDEEGYLYFHGRRDEQIKSSGYRISPLEIETVVHRVEGVSGVVAFGVADEELGAVIRVVIAPHENAQVTTAQILDCCKQHLPAYMVPRDVIIVPTLPRGMSGKIDRTAVKAAHGGSRDKL